MKIIIYAIIGILFIGTIFFSGCSSEDLQGYIDKGKDTLDDFTSSEKTCEEFCDSKNYEKGMCINSDSVELEDNCQGTTCLYNPKVFDKSNNNIQCTEDSCICWDEEVCNNCEERCTTKGCIG